MTIDFERLTKGEREVYYAALEDARRQAAVDAVPESGGASSEFKLTAIGAPIFLALVSAAVGFIEKNPDAAVGTLITVTPWVAGVVIVYMVCRTLLKAVHVWAEAKR